MTFNILEDTCSTCKVWQSVSRQSQFGGCPLKTEGVQGPFIMDRDDACGRWESMEKLADPAEVLEEMAIAIAKDVEPAIDADWSEWESFYGNLLEKSSDD